MKWLYYLFCFLVFSFFSCTDNEQGTNHQKPVWSQDSSSNLNKTLAEQELIRINLFLKQRPNWNMQDTGSGLKYWIYKDLDGVNAQVGDRVDVQFEVKNLKGDVYYSTEAEEFSTFNVDKSPVETGVMEGVKLMSEGDQAKLIIPSHIGHGLMGDMNKIPPLEILVVDLKLVNIQ